MGEQALSGVSVLDLTWYIAGPFCTKLLADYGADVLKVERPDGGDPARNMRPFFGDNPHPEKSGLFLYLNTNKRGITLNLKSEWGMKVVEELVRETDILVESFKPGVMQGLGLGYEHLEKINPKLVMLSISNFGQTGPYRDYKASELIIYGMGGAMNEAGLPDREPLKKATGTPVLFSTGNMAALAAMIALYQAKVDGIGQQVDFSMMEAQMESVDRRMSCLLAYDYNHEITNRSDVRARPVYPAGTYPCKDGWWGITATALQWPAAGKMMGMPEVTDDPRWCNMIVQTAPGHREEFMAIFIPWSLEHTKKECVEAAQAAGANCGPINTMAEVLNDPHLRERGFWTEIEHPFTGRLTYPAGPILAEDMPRTFRRPAPLLGQHNEEIYCDRLGYDKQDLVMLKEEGCI
ncbi:MAG: CoA transferase [Dehalococcoidia bacterium]|nr:MAG: CoA transferase [Dehalococcoidia bacterium]